MIEREIKTKTIFKKLDSFLKKITQFEKNSTFQIIHIKKIKQKQKEECRK